MYRKGGRKEVMEDEKSSLEEEELTVTETNDRSYIYNKEYILLNIMFHALKGRFQLELFICINKYIIYNLFIN